MNKYIDPKEGQEQAPETQATEGTKAEGQEGETGENVGEGALVD
jgi:hypothetical protein